MDTPSRCRATAPPISICGISTGRRQARSLTQPWPRPPMETSTAPRLREESMALVRCFASTLNAPFQAVVNGSLYGVTGPGTTYSVTLAGVYKKLHNKAPGPMWGPFIYGSDLNLYGTTQTGGLNNLGTVFSMSPISGAVNPIYSFSGGDGSAPESSVLQLQGSNTDLYGTTNSGGGGSNGTFFRMTTGGSLTWATGFDPYVGGYTCNNDGGSPSAAPVSAGSGLFYGAASLGGTNCWGTILEVDSSGVLQELLDFGECATCNFGEQPDTTLLADTNGSF